MSIWKHEGSPNTLGPCHSSNARALPGKPNPTSWLILAEEGAWSRFVHNFVPPTLISVDHHILHAQFDANRNHAMAGAGS
jgi:hypothetical protein